MPTIPRNVPYLWLQRPSKPGLLARTVGPDPYEVSLCHTTVGTAQHRIVRRTGDLHLRVNHNKRDEKMIWSWTGDVVVHASVISGFKREGLSGYRVRQSQVQFADGVLSDEYFELICVGWAGIARRQSGIHLIDECSGCHLRWYSPLRYATKLIDWKAWTQEDFFIVWPMVRFILVTERVARVLRKLKVKSYYLSNLETLEKQEVPKRLAKVEGFSVGPLSLNMPEDLAIKYGDPLGLNSVGTPGIR